MVERTFEELIALEVYQPVEVDDDGHILYSCNLQKAKEYAPDIYIAEVRAIDLAILEAIDQGYLEMDFELDEAGDMQVGYVVTEKGHADA